jgi:hypothetical protein
LAHPFSFQADASPSFRIRRRKEIIMKTLLLAASALAMFTAPAHAQLLGGVGQSVTGTLGGSVNSTLRGSTETLRSSTRGTLRGEASTRGNQSVDRRSGSVAVDRSVDTSVEGATSQVLGSQAGNASANGAGSASASGSGSANAQLIGTDAVTGAVRGATSTVRNVATPAVGAARDRLSGTAGQIGNVAGSANGAASGAANGSGMIGGGMLALAGSGAAEGQGAFAVAPGMPVELPSGEQLGTVRDIVATRAGEIRQLVVQTRDGLATIPSGSLSGSGSVLIAAEGSASGAATGE